jgi:hypothetical protein
MAGTVSPAAGFVHRDFRARKRHDSVEGTAFPQTDDHGRAARPVIRNAWGKRGRASRPANALLIGAGPELYEALEGLAAQAEFLLPVLRCEHPLARESAALDRARRLLRRQHPGLLARSRRGRPAAQTRKLGGVDSCTHFSPARRQDFGEEDNCLVSAV